MRLGKAANVRSGLVLSRKAAKKQSKYRYPLLNLRSFMPDGTIDQTQLDAFTTEEALKPEYLTHAGDVVVRLSIPYTAVLIDESTEGFVISSNFVVIRADRRYILPEYLSWLLNTSDFKRRINENTGGNMLGAVKASYFSEYELPPHTLSDQEKLARLSELARRELALIQKLANEKERYYACFMDKVQRKLREEKTV